MEESSVQKIVPQDWDDFVQFIKKHRVEIAEDRYDLRIEKDWARNLDDHDLLLLVEHCPSSRLMIASATKAVAILERLALDDSSDVREAVADNSHCPTNTLNILSNDPVAAVRMAVAENPNVSEEDIERLAGDQANYVRWGVAHNEKTSASVLASLITDRDSYVSDEAKKNPNAPKKSWLTRLFDREK